MKKDKLHTILLVIAILLMATAWATTFFQKTPPNVIKSDTITVHDTIYKDTTITIKELVPKEIVKKKVDTLYLENGDTLNLITESKRYDEVLTSGVDTCEVSAYISGVHPLLDSLSMRLKTHSVTNTVEIIKYVEKKKTFWDRFHWGVQGGIGYGLTQKKIDVFIGVGGTMDI